ncbi:VC2046/SO_2500 family protein [Rheinheimera sp. MMS21-TC3]|uniref:VC2046/SO_2500 family protein n=1 Tax=Rheinheimera sp. MMS21-TC3 TaxID=3072790 RepID=UPI0028C39825|nr:VC2046/SO_2500 family protein [Rheinheimera sp. MMS21-TC3]WNO60825.1 VC2046/SO_2500 family protein [Rheinheimera sp. MMS21-TC3]
MTQIINEWQLDTRLNSALQNKHKGDFSLFLALLSTAVEENAEFLTPDSIKETLPKRNLQQQFNISQQRQFSWQDDDEGMIIKYGRALQQSGLKQVKLISYLKPEPLAFTDDKTKLPLELWQSLDTHSKRRLTATKQLQKQIADPTALYEVLEKIHKTEAA